MKIEIERRYTVDNMVVDTWFRTVETDGKTIFLTYYEFETLVFLLSNVRKVLSREIILNGVWSINTEVSTRVIDTTICNIRKKLGLKKGEVIITVKNLGYMIKK